MAVGPSVTISAAGRVRLFMGRCLVGVSLTAVVAVVGAATIAGPAEAQRWMETEAAEKRIGKGLEPFAAEGPLIAVVSLARQKITVWDRNGVVATSQVSTGRKGFETPEGVFTIIERKEEHNSNLYDDASMPFMQRITWSGVALHAGVVPNYRASHGCIRLPEDFAERLFRTTKLASRVVVTNHDAAPLPISHPLLFQSRQLPVAPIKPEPQQQLAPGRSGPIPAAPPESGDDRPMMLGAAGRVALTAPPATTAPEVRPTPAVADAMEALRLRQTAANKRLADATKAVNTAKTDVRPRLLDQGRTEKVLRQAVALARRAEGRTEAAARQVDTARTDAARALAEVRHIEALAALAEAKGAEAAAQEAATAKTAAAAQIQETVKNLEAERVAALAEQRQITRQLSPVSVFISRQTGRLYIRQATFPVIDMPVAIRDPGQRLGTHVFTALEPRNTKGAIGWVGITVETAAGGPPVPVAVEPEPGKRRKGQQAEPAPAPRAQPDPLQSARAALDRIQIPDEALARILPALQAGSTLLISDLGPSIETGPGTDHVVQTRGEEQAVANIQKFLAKKKAESLAQAQPAFESRSQKRPTNAGFVRSGDWNRW